MRLVARVITVVVLLGLFSAATILGWRSVVHLERDEGQAAAILAVGCVVSLMGTGSLLRRSTSHRRVLSGAEAEAFVRRRLEMRRRQELRAEYRFCSACGRPLTEATRVVDRDPVTSAPRDVEHVVRCIDGHWQALGSAAEVPEVMLYREQLPEPAGARRARPSEALVRTLFILALTCLARPSG